jgi:ribonucleotide monophosphatase NagD (HAD superfamily)
VLESAAGGLALGPGAFVAALKHASGVPAHVVGKPSRTFFETVIADFGFESVPEEVRKIVIIGDDIEADLGGGALELGLWRVLGLLILPHRFTEI